MHSRCYYVDGEMAWEKLPQEDSTLLQAVPDANEPDASEQSAPTLENSRRKIIRLPTNQCIVHRAQRQKERDKEKQKH